MDATEITVQNLERRCTTREQDRPTKHDYYKLRYQARHGLEGHQEMLSMTMLSKTLDLLSCTGGKQYPVSSKVLFPESRSKIRLWLLIRHVAYTLRYIRGSNKFRSDGSRFANLRVSSCS